MSRPDPNIENVRVVAAALGDFVGEAVFLGGSVVGLLLTDDAASPPPDVRGFVAAEVASWLSNADFCNALEGHVERGRDPIVESRLRDIAAVPK